MKDEKEEKEQLSRVLIQSKLELKKVQMQLNVEKSKSKRLTIKNDALEKKFKEVVNRSCVCKTTTTWKISATKQKAKVSLIFKFLSI